MTFLDKNRVLSAADYYADEGTRALCHRVKTGDLYACEAVAKILSEQILLPPDGVLIPIPSRSGYATHNLTICLILAKITGNQVADCIKGQERPALYDLKKAGLPVSPALLSLSLSPEHNTFTGPCFLFDAVVDTGATMSACLSLLKHHNAFPLTFAMTERRRYTQNIAAPEIPTPSYNKPPFVEPQNPTTQTALISSSFRSHNR